MTRVAGRDLDALVGEVVVGWQWESISYKDDTGFKWTSPTGKEELVWHPLTVPRAMPRFSTDIGSAWPLAERFHLTLTPRLNRWCAARADAWRNEEGTDYVGTQVGWTEAATAPLAICLAALEAAGVTEEAK